VTSNGHYYEDLKGSISLSEHIKWNKDLINALNDYWSWTELCSNESISWDLELVSQFEEKVDFKSLSSNSKVIWTQELIDKYVDKWDWKKLSGNQGLPWSKKLIIKYENRWQWKPDTNSYTFDKYYFYPSLSTNSGINWDTDMLLTWKNNLDFWRIALFGRISNDAIKYFQSEFNRKELVSIESHKYSDWRATSKIHRTGWENLALNDNFKIHSLDIEYYFETKLALTYPVGNFARYGNYKTKEFRLLDILKEKPLHDFKIHDIITSKNSWGKILINKSFINDSVWELIKPFVDKKFISDFLILVSKNESNFKTTS